MSVDGLERTGHALQHAILFRTESQWMGNLRASKARTGEEEEEEEGRRVQHDVDVVLTSRLFLADVLRTNDRSRRTLGTPRSSGLPTLFACPRRIMPSRFRLSWPASSSQVNNLEPVPGARAVPSRLTCCPRLSCGA